jgi:hypothetical protein
MVEGTHFFASENPYLLINPALAFIDDVDLQSLEEQNTVWTGTTGQGGTIPGSVFAEMNPLPAGGDSRGE